MILEELIPFLNDRLTRLPIAPKHSLSQFRLNNEDYRSAAEYTDPTHYPFYYYLGRAVGCKNLLEIGFESGIESGCFLHGNKGVESYLGFRHKASIEYWSPRMPRKNIIDVLKKPISFWNGEINDPEFLKQFLIKKWDCALVVRSESRVANKTHLNLVWGQMSLGGVIAVDRVRSDPEMKAAFEDFCKTCQRPQTIFNTRYGTGILIK
jgi:hypothetical protein